MTQIFGAYGYQQSAISHPLKADGCELEKRLKKIGAGEILPVSFPREG